MTKSIFHLLGLAVCIALTVQPLRGETPDIHQPGPSWPKSLHVYDHIVIVMEENKNYEQVIDNDWAPYINSVLKKEGATLTRMYGEEHHSEGNYFWLISGGNQGVGFKDEVPAHAFEAPNLVEKLLKKGLTFKGYSENLPSVGSDAVVFPAPPQRALYARKHVPWVSFSNIPPTCSVPYSEFPKDAAGFKQLPTLSIVVPNLINDMHDGQPSSSVPAGDTWLKQNLDAYYQWAKDNNSLLILTFDENDDKANYSGLTNPQIHPGGGPNQEMRRDIQNQIPTVFAGAHIKPGEYSEGVGVTHVNLLRTLEAMYGLAKSGAQQANAAGAGITDDYVITDVFE